MKLIEEKKMYIRPVTEELGMSDGIGLLRGSWKQEGESSSATSQDPKEGMFATREDEFGNVSDF